MRTLWKLIRSLFGYDEDPDNPLKGPARPARNAWDTVSARREGPADSSRVANPQLVRRRMNGMAAALVAIVLLVGIGMWIADSVGTTTYDATQPIASAQDTDPHPTPSQHRAAVVYDSAIYTLRHYTDQPSTYLIGYDSRGTQRWHTRLRRDVRLAYNLQMVADSAHVLIYDRSHAQAYSAQDGSLLWYKALPSQVTNYNQATLHLGVWLVVMEKTLHAYDLRTGAELWTRPLNISYIPADYRPLPVDDGIAVPDGENGLTDMQWVVCHTRTGARLRSLQPQARLPGAPYLFSMWSTCRVYDLPAARQRLLMYGTIGGYSALQAFDWNLRTPGQVYPLPTDTYQDFRTTYRGHIVAGHKIYICPKTRSGSQGNQLLEVDTQAGTVRQLLVHEQAEHVPIGLYRQLLAVYVRQGTQAKVLVYDLARRAVQWEYTLGNKVLAGWHYQATGNVDLQPAGHELMLWYPALGSQSNLIVLDWATRRTRTLQVQQPMGSILRVWPLGRGWVVVPDTYPFLWRAGQLIPLSTAIAAG